MPDPPRRYVRVYYSIVTDPRFAEVYHNARHLGTWLQLLLVADAMYPADAPLPAYVNRASVRVLTQCGLIEERPHQHYAVHGLASERDMRAQSPRNAAVQRWQSERTADAVPIENAGALPTQSERSPNAMLREEEEKKRRREAAVEANPKGTGRAGPRGSLGDWSPVGSILPAAVEGMKR